jgi:hypothetical protein
LPLFEIADYEIADYEIADYEIADFEIADFEIADRNPATARASFRGIQKNCTALKLNLRRAPSRATD